jgi:uncharacterized protein YecT (DUF1311 family)
MLGSVLPGALRTIAVRAVSRAALPVFAGCLSAALCVAKPAGPSFDCRRAQGSVEKAICRNPDLAGLDRAVDRAYRAALQRLGDRPARQALEKEQRLFLKAREVALDHPDYGLAAFLKDRREFLDSILPPSQGFEGTWRNGFGEITIVRKPDGSFQVSAGNGEWITAHWLCEYDGTGRVVDESLEITPSEPDIEWEMILARNGSALRLTERPKGESSVQPPYCGHRGSLDGAYFRATPIVTPN